MTSVGYSETFLCHFKCYVNYLTGDPAVWTGKTGTAADHVPYVIHKLGLN